MGVGTSSELLGFPASLWLDNPWNSACDSRKSREHQEVCVDEPALLYRASLKGHKPRGSATPSLHYACPYKARSLAAAFPCTSHGTPEKVTARKNTSPALLVTGSHLLAWPSPACCFLSCLQRVPPRPCSPSGATLLVALPGGRQLCVKLPHVHTHSCPAALGPTGLPE